MSARSFFDTNVLVYMADKDEPDKISSSGHWPCSKSIGAT